MQGKETCGCLTQQHLLSLKDKIEEGAKRGTRDGITSKNRKQRHSRCSQMKDYSSNNATAVPSIKLPLLSVCFHFLHPLYSCVLTALSTTAYRFAVLSITTVLTMKPDFHWNRRNEEFDIKQRKMPARLPAVESQLDAQKPV